MKKIFIKSDQAVIVKPNSRCIAPERDDAETAFVGGITTANKFLLLECVETFRWCIIYLAELSLVKAMQAQDID
jgi:hypothetical protein